MSSRHPPGASPPPPRPVRPPAAVERHGDGGVPGSPVGRIPFTGPGHAVAARLPAPFATRSAVNGAPLVDRPAGVHLTVPPGLQIDAWATDLPGVRAMALAPNGDVMVSDHLKGRVLLLRDADGDGVAELRSVFASRLTMPFGLVFLPGYLYVAATDAVVRLAYTPGDLTARSAPEHLVDLPGGGYHQHWTRALAVTPDGHTVYVSAGSRTNASEEADPRRAAIQAMDPDGVHARVFASGLRNPVAMAVHPTTGVLYAVVNERDDLGDDLVPDYLTSVRDGAFYGWPYSYFGAHPDPRLHGARPDLVARAVVPDVSLGAHVAAVGLMFYTGGMLPADYQGDALISLHGSWNRAQRVGYEVVRARFRDGMPTGALEDLVTGWVLPDGSVWGRPVGLLQLPDGSVLVMDDGSETLWRIHRGAHGPG